jgi:hypothetical protein
MPVTKQPRVNDDDGDILEEGGLSRGRRADPLPALEGPGVPAHYFVAES